MLQVTSNALRQQVMNNEGNLLICFYNLMRSVSKTKLAHSTGRWN